MKSFFWIICIVIIAVAVRVLYNLHSPLYETTGDTVSYYLTAKMMIKNRVVVDPWRTPVYPMILASPFAFTGKMMPDNVVGVYIPEFWDIRVLQSAGGVLMVVLLFLLLIRLRFTPRVAGLYCLFIACDNTFLLFEHTMLTEAFAALWLVSTILLTVRLLSRFSAPAFISFVFMWVIGTFLRPSFIALPIVLSAILVWKYWNRNIIVWSLLGLFVYGAVLIGYSFANARTYDYPGISRISDVNLWGKILALRLPIVRIPDARGVKPMLQATIDMKSDDPWQAFRQFPELYDTTYAAPFHQFITEATRQSILPYVFESTGQLPGALVSKSDVVDVTATNRFNWLFGPLQLAYQYAMYINFTVIVAFPVFLYEAWKKKNTYNIALVLFVLVGLYQIGVGVYLGYNDYARHISIAQPFLYLTSFVVWYRLIMHVKNSVIKRA